MTRKEIAEKLYEATTYYMVKKMFSVHREFGIEKWGKRRLDLLCFDFKTEIIGYEIKSCLADYRSDSKFQLYLPYVNKLYVVFPPSVINSRVFPEIKAELKGLGVGIMTLPASGRLKCVLGAKTRPVSIVAKYRIFVKMAWRGGDSKRNIKRTKRVFLE